MFSIEIAATHVSVDGSNIPSSLILSLMLNLRLLSTVRRNTGEKYLRRRGQVIT